MTYTILHVDSSPMGDRSVSRKLTAKAMAELKAKHPDATVIERDLAAHPLPHLTGEVVGAFYTPPDKRSPEQAKAVEPSDKAVDELLSADAIVIGAPMWNFNIPSSLKAWIDHVVRVGRTFQYGEKGPSGLVDGASKQVIVVTARGGVYSTGPFAAAEHQETYLRAILGFMGFTNITFATAEGLAYGEDAARAAVTAAETQVSEGVAKAA